LSGAALLSFCAMAVAVRSLSGTLKVMEILTIRSVGGLVLLPLLADPAHLRVLSARRLLLHISRNTFHFVGQFLRGFRLDHGRIMGERRPGRSLAQCHKNSGGRSVRCETLQRSDIQKIATR
jgi:hypothetical protein